MNINEIFRGLSTSDWKIQAVQNSLRSIILCVLAYKTTLSKICRARSARLTRTLQQFFSPNLWAWAASRTTISSPIVSYCNFLGRVGCFSENYFLHLIYELISSRIRQWATQSQSYLNFKTNFHKTIRHDLENVLSYTLVQVSHYKMLRFCLNLARSFDTSVVFLGKTAGCYEYNYQAILQCSLLRGRRGCPEVMIFILRVLLCALKRYPPP